MRRWGSSVIVSYKFCILYLKKGFTQMKSRKTLIALFLVVSTLVIGVGYAALSDTLDINGTADVTTDATNKDFDADVYFSAAVANVTGDTASVNPDNADKASFSINSITAIGQSASFTFTITNASDEFDAVVTPALNATAGNTMADYFEIESDWAAQPRTVAAGGTATYTVTVTLIKSPQENISGSFHIELKAASVETANP